MNAGATPVLVDIDHTSFHINANLIEQRETKKTKAIVPVHLCGTPCAMDSILSIAKKYKLYVIEDKAQAQGAAYKSQKTGGLGIMNFTSFYPTKNIGTLGDGGMITTDSEELYNKAISVRNYGKSPNDGYSEIGMNSRLDELQARILSVKLKYLEKWNEERRKIASWYKKGLEGVEEIRMQSIDPNAISVYHLFPIISNSRNELKIHLKCMGVDTLIHYEEPIHLHESFSFLSHKKSDFPIAEDVCNKELSLPIYPGIDQNDVNSVCQQIRKFYSKN